ncbi:MAG: ribosome small subunit-dependent GTPase A [Gammaproteobacteria bacterium]|nr:ribosome small subunit-dependent GTPase A [Gammaproteobacteria bacterium]
MSKRRLSHHQQRRIKQAHHSLKSTDVDNENTFHGLVISHRGGLINVENCHNNKQIKCKPRANLGTIICGDKVIVQKQKGDYVIAAISERNNIIQRIDGFGKIHSVAANISQLVIFMSVVPEPNIFLLDQYLVSAHINKILPLIVLNKTDLLTNDPQDPFNLNAIYQPLGYTIHAISLKNDAQFDAIEEQFKQHVNLISGVSGAGKSSLIKKILPQHDHIKVAEISAFNKEGKHTTRTSTLYHLPCGGQLIDTPGIRGFNPVFNDKDDIKKGFIEISALATQCKFNNCEHTHEPQCAVLEAVEKGAISPSRYENYVKLLENF